MAKKRPQNTTDSTAPVIPPVGPPFLGAPGGSSGDQSRPLTTGRFVIIFKPEIANDAKAMRAVLGKAAGASNVASSADFEEGAVTSAAMNDSDVMQFDRLGIAIVSSLDVVQSLQSVASDTDSVILAIEPEYIAYLSSPVENALSREYMRGYRDAVNHLCDKGMGDVTTSEQAGLDAQISTIFNDNAQFTWGLQATRVHTSRFSGAGIKVAVLDTGIDLSHRDFAGRLITSRSFSGAPVQDVNGHGTHCAGTSCGPRSPASGVRRYGCAHNAQLFVGKVFDNNPRPGASTGNVVAGIEWAVANGCRVVSLSLGAPVNQQIMQYHQPIRNALAAGTLVIAAAGNNANRPGLPKFDPARPATTGFVEPPANADHAMAVAAIDSRERIAVFSARSSAVTGVGGIVNIAGPGVDVFSSIPGSTHSAFHGTSMATPHVAGIAALWAQAENLSGASLWNRLIQTTKGLNIPSIDVGAGLVQAPQ